MDRAGTVPTAIAAEDDGYRFSGSADPGRLCVPGRDDRDAVAPAPRVWQRSAMNRPSQSPKAGGMPIALGTLGGAIIGAVFGEATIGLLVGLALGIGIAVWIWRRDRV